MADNNDILIIAAVALGAYILSTQSVSPEAVYTEESVIAPGSKAAPLPAYPIVFGKYHPHVKLLQQALAVKEDGIVGNQTLAVWKKYHPELTTAFKITSFAALKNEVDSINVRKNFW